MENIDEDLQKKIIEEFKLRIEKPISKDEFNQIYNRAKSLYEEENNKDFLSQRKFAIEYLGLTVSAYKMMIGGYANAKVLKDYVVENEEIERLRKRIIYEENLHIGDLKSYRELLEYYNKYFIPLTEKDFFEKILDVSSYNLKNIQPKKDSETEEKEKRTGIIKNEIVTDEEVDKLKQKVLKGELLHKDDKINYKKFLEIYQKYFIPLSEEEFAKRILDINKKAYTKIKFYPDKEAIILSDIKIPDNIEQIRRQIIRKEKLHRKDEITFTRFNEILDNNYLPISRINFADLILDISDGSFRSAKYDAKRKMVILGKEEYPEKEEIEKIRKDIIQFYRLHKGDKITYSQFLKIYTDERFYTTLPEEDFAKAMFDIEKDSYEGIKYSVREDTSILKNEVVSKQEIENVRTQILEEFKIGQKITYDELEYIYNKYYLKLSIKEYADKVLDIKAIKDLKNKRYDNKDPKNPGKTKKMKTMIFLGEELEKLKHNVIISNMLYDGLEITRDHFMKLYKEYSHALSYLMFGKLILGMNMNDTNALVLGRNRKVRVNTNLHPDINESNKEKFIENQYDRIEELLYSGNLSSDIADKLMISQYDIDKKISQVMQARNIDRKRVDKARVKQKLFSDITLYKIAIKLHMNIEDVKQISTIIIAEEIQKYMNQDGLTFEDAVEEIQKELLSVRGKISKDFVSMQKDKDRIILTARARRLIEEYEGKPKQKKNLKAYVDLCRDDIKNGEFDKANIDILEQSIFFLDRDDENIEFFTRYCIKQGEYGRANGFLAYYLNDYSISLNDKTRLQALYEEIKLAKKRSETIQLVIGSSKVDKQNIAQKANVKLYEVSDAKRQIDTSVSKILTELM